MNINECIKIMKSEVKDAYAQSYLDAIPQSIEEYGKEGLRVQLLYVLENCRSWKGEQAREIKKFARKWIKDNE